MVESCLNTFSIVGRCSRTGELGAAVATAVPAVGAICLYFEPEIGAVSTQSWTNPYLATAILGHLKCGMSAADAMEAVMADDPAAEFRQVGAIAKQGLPASYSGKNCTGWFGHRLGQDYAAQGNMLTGSRVIEAMGDAFDMAFEESLDERLLRALEAAQKAGGDKRGKQSAALKVVNGEVYARVDLRVDEHGDPIAELRRIAGIARAQLAPFIAGMPKRQGEAAPAPQAVVDMLLKSPPDRPAGGGSAKP